MFIASIRKLTNEFITWSIRPTVVTFATDPHLVSPYFNTFIYHIKFLKWPCNKRDLQSAKSSQLILLVTPQILNTFFYFTIFELEN
jgi:hypothetical protein